MSSQVATTTHPDYQAPLQYPAFNKQKKQSKWKQLQEQAKKEKKESIELLSEKSSINTSPVNKSGKQSPQSKFIFTQKPQVEKKSITLIKPFLTMAELEQINTNTCTHTHTHDLSRSPSISPISSISISPEPIFEKETSLVNEPNTPQRSRQRTMPSPMSRQRSSISQSPNPIDIGMDISMDIGSSNMALHRPIPSRSPIKQQYVQQKQHYNSVSISPGPIQMSHDPISPDTIQITPLAISPLAIFTHKYNLQKHIITTIKELVFQHSSLICGSFNSQQFVINEYYKAFHPYIISYELSNNMKLTRQQINYLFIDETINPETKGRIDLQKSIEILTTGNKMNSFIDSINQCFNIVKGPYKIEHINRGNIKTVVELTHDLQHYSHNHNGNEIYLHIVKISIPEYNIVFEVRFLILENEKLKLDNSYVIPLQLHIPEGLYDAEHLHVTNNGHDVYNIQYSSSPIDFIINNINMKIVSLMPKLNDYDYKKITQYISEIIPTNLESLYIYEFDIFNTIHKKSDFWLCNKNKEVKTEHNQEHSCNKCNKCNVDISTNSRYVITKCCHKKYHIECMEMNYYTKLDTRYLYSYLLCDCGCLIIDENACNSRLLVALYKNYY
jgi:hypothetical protein